MKIAVFAGSFDPFTLGHLDIIKKGVKIFDKIIILVAINENKSPRYSVVERVKMIKEATKNINNVVVDSFNGLTVEYASKNNALYLLRGIRNKKDLKYEIELANKNKELNPQIETFFVKTSFKCKNISSTKIRELLDNKEKVDKFVPKEIIKYL